MIFRVSDGEAGIISYFRNGSGLFRCLIDRFGFREADVARGPDESDLGVN